MCYYYYYCICLCHSKSNTDVSVYLDVSYSYWFIYEEAEKEEAKKMITTTGSENQKSNHWYTLQPTERKRENLSDCESVWYCYQNSSEIPSGQHLRYLNTAPHRSICVYHHIDLLMFHIISAIINSIEWILICAEKLMAPFLSYGIRYVYRSQLQEILFTCGFSFSIHFVAGFRRNQTEVRKWTCTIITWFILE